jgi:hypothetical protein
MSDQDEDIEWEDDEEEEDHQKNEESIFIEINNLNHKKKQKKKVIQSKLQIKDSERQLAHDRHKEDLLNIIDKSQIIFNSCNDDFLMSILQVTIYIIYII